MNKIKQTFDKEFKRWSVTLPAQAVKKKTPATIRSAGWNIRYRFDTADGVDFIEYFAEHRMTNSFMNRIYADGRIEYVGDIIEGYDPNDPRGQEAMRANEAFINLVRQRGLLP